MKEVTSYSNCSLFYPQKYKKKNNTITVQVHFCSGTCALKGAAIFKGILPTFSSLIFIQGIYSIKILNISLYWEKDRKNGLSIRISDKL